MMNFFKKKVPLVWVIIPALGWGLTFLFGTGVFWESRKTPLLTIQIAQGLADLYQKKTAAIEELLKPEMKTLDNDSPVYKSKHDHLRALEKTIAQIEGRSPVPYGRPAPAFNFRVVK